MPSSYDWRGIIRVDNIWRHSPVSQLYIINIVANIGSYY